VMRLAPVPLFYAKRPEEAIGRSGESSRTTHGSPACIDGCRYLGALIVGALNGASKEELLSERYGPVPEYWEKKPLMNEIDRVARGSFKHADPPFIQATGYVVKTLEAALWAFNRTDNFRDGCLMAVNLGDDADTVGAVYGQIAGAFYGLGNIPESWRERIHKKEMIIGFADRLLELSRSI
jgi:ADP-ribosyl-[dinitrogen reductase] hydrolase